MRRSGRRGRGAAGQERLGTGPSLRIADVGGCRGRPPARVPVGPWLSTGGRFGRLVPMSHGAGDRARTSRRRLPAWPILTAVFVGGLAVAVTATVFAVRGTTVAEGVQTLLLMAFASSLTLLVLHRVHHA